MPVGITIPKKSGGIFESEGFKKGMGIARMAAGDPSGALAFLPNSPAKSAGGAYSAIDSAMKKQAPQAPDASPTLPVGQPMPTGEYNPMASRLAALGSDPNAAVDQGLAALRSPEVPGHLRQAYAEPLLRAKYFGQRSIA